MGKNVNQLIDDILYFKDTSSYRLGTVVIHKDNNCLNIVDGQQRITTLLLLLKAVDNEGKFNKILEGEEYAFEWPEFSYTSPISIKNIKGNFQELTKRVKQVEFDEKIVDFLLRKCEVVYIELEDITEAFQFFDSQNARGKDLAPHDLLKAFHLREMGDVDEQDKLSLVSEWEKLDDKGELKELFNDYLYKIRNWSRGKSARYFTKKDVNLFKGISVNQSTKELYPFAMIYQMANIFVEDYNQHSSRKIDFYKLSYPFSLDLPILNGKRFFEMITHYHNRIQMIREKNSYQTLQLIDRYEGKGRTGDRYVKLLFECALIYYIDKFGEKDLEKIVDKLFVWAYTLRLQLQAVQLASVDNRAIYTDVFGTIKNANTHYEVLNMHIANYIGSIVELKGTEELKTRFQELGYM